MIEHDRDDDAPLDRLFHQARSHGNDLSDDLFARIMDDAARVQAERAAPAATPRAGWLAGLGALLGGWPSVAGLATAAAAGLWIGVAQPVALDGFALVPGADAAGYDLDDLMPDVDVLASEG